MVPFCQTIIKSHYNLNIFFEENYNLNICRGHKEESQIVSKPRDHLAGEGGQSQVVEDPSHFHCKFP
jgi:hypothetical protein